MGLFNVLSPVSAAQWETFSWTATGQMWHLVPRPQYEPRRSAIRSVSRAAYVNVKLHSSIAQWGLVSCKLHHQSHHRGVSLYKWLLQRRLGPNTIWNHLYLLLSARIMEVDDHLPRQTGFFCLASGCEVEALWRPWDGGCEFWLHLAFLRLTGSLLGWGGTDEISS